MYSDRLLVNSSTKKIGWIELITGCMFAGKTEEFIRRLKRYKYAHKNILIFKPTIDQRYSVKNVVSHSGLVIESFSVESVEKMKEIFNKENSSTCVDIVGIDEVQFFNTEIVEYITNLANLGVVVIANGLDKDFRGEPFRNVDRLLVEAEYVEKLTAICHNCGNVANNTQRLIDGKPAKKDGPLILVDSYDSYEARCRNCYQKPK